jgi:hypothetical protein
MGDPFFAHCAHAERIFVVDKSLNIYEKSGPGFNMGSGKLPDDYAEWRMYSAPGGLRFPYRSTWKIEPRTDPDALVALTIQRPEWPDYPIVVRVYKGDPPAKLLKGKNGGVYLIWRLRAET